MLKLETILSYITYFFRIITFSWNIMTNRECRAKIDNVKVRFCLCPSVRKELIQSIKYWEEAIQIKPQYFLYTKFPNYRVFQNYLVYTIFTDLENTYFRINITGIPSADKIVDSVGDFCLHFNVPREKIITNIIVDSIFASGNFKRSINLRLLMRLINGKEECNFKVKFNCETSAAAYCRHKTFGTIGVFRTGKYIILGAKCSKTVNQLVQEMTVLIQDL
jgi:TATA-box binding protein (TBP) (component of TFIID and TFIIIB)